eukprot:UC4_evm1s1214
MFSLNSKRVLIVDRGENVGETFRLWPKEMRFISPSFNQQGWTDSFDLNSIAYNTSPAHTIFAEHPSGEQYASYLQHVAEANSLNIQTKTEVLSIKSLDCAEGFAIEMAPTKSQSDIQKPFPKTIHCRYIIWAAGEFQYPKATEELFPGSEYCTHNSTIRSWGDLPGNNYIVIGGYESGMDAAVNLSKHGKNCTVISSTAFWNVATNDPSTELAPYTADRVRTACASKTPPNLVAPMRVSSVERDSTGCYVVHAKKIERETDNEFSEDEQSLGKFRVPLHPKNHGIEGILSDTMTFKTPQPPLLCTGFDGGVKMGVVKNLFSYTDPEQTNNLQSMNAEKEKEQHSAIMETIDGHKDVSTIVDHTGNDGEIKGAAENSPRSDSCTSNIPLLNEHDESTKTPGLFLVGPGVVHDDLSFCFVYKFRQRFGVVADCIAQGLDYRTEDAVESCRDMNMYLDDFSCCKAACGETC